MSDIFITCLFCLVPPPNKLPLLGVWRRNPSCLSPCLDLKQAFLIFSWQDLDVVGDGMQCPPSPLLSISSAALENQLNRNVAETSINTHSSEESAQQGLLNQSVQPGRGGFPRHTASPASEFPPEPPSQVLDLSCNRKRDSFHKCAEFACCWLRSHSLELTQIA